MTRSLMTPISVVGLLLLFCCCADVSGAEYLMYKDPKQPINARIKDLMSRMTLEEKIGQMVQIDRSVASAEVMKKYYIGNCPYRPILNMYSALNQA